jgi:predicted DNA-binding transcriptional regulator YafY
MAGSNETLERLEEMERMLMRRKWTTTELAYEFGVDPSTIYRNIELLEAMGSPIEKDQDRRKGRRYWIDQQRFLNRVRVTLHEATALYLGARLLSRMIDTSNQFVVTALHKLAEPLDVSAPLLAKHIHRAAHAVHVRPHDVLEVEVFRVLAQAWGESRKVRIVYQAQQRTEATERVLSPYYLEPVEAEQAIYVLGHDSRSDGVRVFKLDRIRALELLPDTFRFPDAFDPLDQLQSAWGIMWADEGQSPERVVIEFAPEVAREIKERYWHPTQRLTDLPDGSLRFEVTVGHASELRRWIRRWGLHNLHLIEPQWLRDELLDEMQVAVGRWEKQ